MSAQRISNQQNGQGIFSQVLNEHGSNDIYRRIESLEGDMRRSKGSNHGYSKKIEELYNTITQIQKEIDLLKNQNRKLIELSSGNSAEILEVLYQTRDRVDALERLQPRR